MCKAIKISTYILLIFLITIFHGCANKPENPRSDTTITNLEERLKHLEEEVKNLKTEIGFNDATISTEEKAYDIAKTKVGSFVIICKNVTPYLDGYKVNLLVGNLTAGSFQSFKLHIIWGIPNTKEIKERDFELANKLLPAEYTPVEVILTPAKPGEIKQIQVGIELNQIGLKNF